ETWQNPRKQLNPKLGEAFARMYIPAFGEDFQFAIVEGTHDNDLLRGPGRYEDTQMPGEESSFAVSGHRVGKGSPLNGLGSLATCDAIAAGAQTTRGIYRVLPVAEGEGPRWDVSARRRRTSCRRNMPTCKGGILGCRGHDYSRDGSRKSAQDSQRLHRKSTRTIRRTPIGEIMYRALWNLLPGPNR